MNMTSFPSPSTQAQPTSLDTPPAWMNYLWGAFIALVVIFLCWGGLTLMAEVSRQQIQKEYLLLTDDASRASFAKRHANHPLGGLVLLGQAHDYYASGNYAAAKEAYAKAEASGLKNEPILHEEAVLGLAFSAFALNTDQGLAALKTIAQNTQLMDSTRAHAAAELLGYWIAQADWSQARDYWALLKTLPNAKPWQQHVSHLAEVYPQLVQ